MENEDQLYLVNSSIAQPYPEAACDRTEKQHKTAPKPRKAVRALER